MGDVVPGVFLSWCVAGVTGVGCAAPVLMARWNTVRLDAVHPPERPAVVWSTALRGAGPQVPAAHSSAVRVGCDAPRLCAFLRPTATSGRQAQETSVTCQYQRLKCRAARDIGAAPNSTDDRRP